MSEIHDGLRILEDSRKNLIDLLTPLVGNCTYDELYEIAEIIRTERKDELERACREWEKNPNLPATYMIERYKEL